MVVLEPSGVEVGFGRRRDAPRVEVADFVLGALGNGDLEEG